MGRNKQAPWRLQKNEPIVKPSGRWNILASHLDPMYIQKKYSWQLPDSAVTPQSTYLGRRQFLRTCGLGMAASALLPTVTRAATFGFPDSLNEADKLPGTKLTSYEDITGYNNFYEWGLDKGDPKVFANKGWKTEPWTIEIGGLCAKPRKYDVNDLVKAIGGIEQRNYRHRCVEAWSMVIPWEGSPWRNLSPWLSQRLKRSSFNSLPFWTRKTVQVSARRSLPGLTLRV